MVQGFRGESDVSLFVVHLDTCWTSSELDNCCCAGTLAEVVQRRRMVLSV